MRPGRDLEGDTMEVSDADKDGPQTDFNDALKWVDKVWDEPLLLWGSLDDVEKRRHTHDATKARALAMWAARSTPPSATPWEMAEALNVDGWEQVAGELWDGRLPGELLNIWFLRIVGGVKEQPADWSSSIGLAPAKK